MYKHFNGTEEVEDSDLFAMIDDAVRAMNRTAAMVSAHRGAGNGERLAAARQRIAEAEMWLTAVKNF